MRLLVKEVDEGQEQESLQPIQVQIIWGSIARKKHNHPVLYKGLKQALQYHSVCDVKNLELINEEESEVLRELISYYCNSLSCSTFELFIHVVLHLMHHKHELRVVHFLLASANIQRLVEQIDHVRLATSRVPPYVHIFETVQVFERILDPSFLKLLRVHYFFTVT